jgi:hypothetical protein
MKKTIENKLKSATARDATFYGSKRERKGSGSEKFAASAPRLPG